ncbi:hypothetical protein [Moorena sp. SIO3I6]|uniref:hypothetical protein n=1 Tax=Moorena sp. SIO3I6 TaxID=2607831 RepID=UPI0013F931C6|nr:hypothetical protein [Moorena sp. SIO3I6]NEP20486.1 hypothetical protein [Moorena sp. SIO3I6]
MTVNTQPLIARIMALLNQRMNMSGVGILPARKYIETGKMPVPRLMPIPQVRPKGDLLTHWKAHLLLKSFHY